MNKAKLSGVPLNKSNMTANACLKSRTQQEFRKRPHNYTACYASSSEDTVIIIIIIIILRYFVVVLESLLRGGQEPVSRFMSV
eukprot:5111346-Amphidinium_carterae.1